MREIFRGKRKDNGEWVCGNLLTYNSRYWIFQSEGIVSSHFFNITGKYEEKDTVRGFIVEVIPKTVGQYTGHKDCQPKKIFAGDIVEDKNGNIGLVEWSNLEAKFEIIWISGRKRFIRQQLDTVMGEIKIIGNKFDNSELLKEEQ